MELVYEILLLTLSSILALVAYFCDASHSALSYFV